MKTFLITLFWKQNKWHKHGVFVHTLKVFWHCFEAKRYDLLTTAIMHDFGKPFAAHQKPEDIINDEYSFTDHEEKSYQIIKNWPFVCDRTKNLVRWHFLLRDIEKKKAKGEDYKFKQDIFDSLSNVMQSDLRAFLKYDDLGKL